jgi:hypothetical protein
MALASHLIPRRGKIIDQNIGALSIRRKLVKVERNNGCIFHIYIVMFKLSNHYFKMTTM